LNRLRNSTFVLQQAGEESFDSLSDKLSVWPVVSQSLRKPLPRRSSLAWSQAWVPTVAIASMVLAMISIFNTLSAPQPDGYLVIGPVSGTSSDAMTASEQADPSTRLLRPRVTESDRLSPLGESQR
jgi:hypothetical protein